MGGCCENWSSRESDGSGRKCEQFLTELPDSQRLNRVGCSDTKIADSAAPIRAHLSLAPGDFISCVRAERRIAILGRCSEIKAFARPKRVPLVNMNPFFLGPKKSPEIEIGRGGLDTYMVRPTIAQLLRREANRTRGAETARRRKVERGE